MGNYNTGGAGTAPRPQMGAAGGAPQPILNRDSPQILQNMRGFAPERNGPTEILNRPSPGEQQEPMGRPNPRPMGGGLMRNPNEREIVEYAPGTRPGGGEYMDPSAGGMPRDGRRLPNGDVVGRGDPRYFDRGPGIGINPNGRYGPRSYQPGHGNGNGGYGMRGDVRTKGVQNASMGDPMQGDPNSPDAQLRVKRRYERGMSAPAPQENQSYSMTGGGASI